MRRSKSKRVRATPSKEWTGRLNLRVKDGTVIVGGDAHYWPGKPPVMHRALVKLIEKLEPNAVIMNGDPLDLSSISAHPPIGWERSPTVHEEIEVGQIRLGELEEVSGSAALIWPLGNHDARFETRLAKVAPEYRKVKGLHLHEHFALWQPCWSVMINENTMVKHRLMGGAHAPYNNVKKAGTHVITGHLHSQKVVPVTNYKGTLYGVDAGCIADAGSRQFNYTEDGPVDWRSGFCVLTFVDGMLLYPELVTKVDHKRYQFRGGLYAL